MAARRSAILTAARIALSEKGVDGVTLRDISERVGLAKSNVLRYFDTREAILLEVLDGELRDWVSELAQRLGPPHRRKAGYASEKHFARIVAETLVERQLLCELLGAMSAVLERNISADYARDFKVRAMQSIRAITELTSEQLPWLQPDFAAFFGEATLSLVAGMYPFSTPTEPVRSVIDDLGFPDPKIRFSEGLRTGLTTWLIGAAAQGSA
jgi:AcrR family transcriptional regulator